ncbi:MAG: class I SAM-dependent methyltransferase [FCB group bacterium]|nr:class I SAM-dependent methyltransferase [FCB group bacterium]
MPHIDPFEKHWERYEKWFDDNQYVYQSELKAIKKLLPTSGVGVEIGVGSGKFAAPLDIALGVEPSEKMRALAAQRGIEVVAGVAEKLPFPNNVFDYALMVTAICFVDDPQVSVAEVFRILKPKGAFVIGFVDKESPLGKLYQKNKEQNVFYKDAKFYSSKEIKTYMVNVGFENFTFCQTVFHLLNQVKSVEEVKDGYGEGSFVVIKGIKPR